MGGLCSRTRVDKLHYSIDYIQPFELFYYRYINDNSLKFYGNLSNDPVLSIHGLFTLFDFLQYLTWGYGYTIVCQYKFNDYLTNSKLRKKFMDRICNDYSYYYTKNDIVYMLILLIFEIIDINKNIPNLDYLFKPYHEEILKKLVIPESIYNSIRKINNKYINENTNYLLLLQSNENKYSNVNNTIQTHLIKTKSVIDNNIKILSNINECIDNSIMMLSIMGKINNTELLKNNQGPNDPISSAPLIVCIKYNNKEMTYSIPSAQIIENELEVILCDK